MTQGQGAWSGSRTMARLVYDISRRTLLQHTMPRCRPWGSVMVSVCSILLVAQAQQVLQPSCDSNEMPFSNRSCDFCTSQSSFKSFISTLCPPAALNSSSRLPSSGASHACPNRLHISSLSWQTPVDSYLSTQTSGGSTYNHSPWLYDDANPRQELGFNSGATSDDTLRALVMEPTYGTTSSSHPLFLVISWSVLHLLCCFAAPAVVLFYTRRLHSQRIRQGIIPSCTENNDNSSTGTKTSCAVRGSSHHAAAPVSTGAACDDESRKASSGLPSQTRAPERPGAAHTPPATCTSPESPAQQSTSLSGWLPTTLRWFTISNLLMRFFCMMLALLMRGTTSSDTGTVVTSSVISTIASTTACLPIGLVSDGSLRSACAVT